MHDFLFCFVRLHVCMHVAGTCIHDTGDRTLEDAEVRRHRERWVGGGSPEGWEHLSVAKSWALWVGGLGTRDNREEIPAEE